MSFGLIHNFNNYRVASGGSIAVGRSAATGENNTDGLFPIGLGSAAADGAWLVLIVYSNSSCSVGAGGAAWTTSLSDTSQYKVYYKKAASEPASYNISWSTGAKADGCSAALIEITGANATNPDDSAIASTTATTPSATASTSGEISVAVWLGTVSAVSAPSGYTMQQNYNQATANTCVAIATKTGIGSGANAPGNWGATSSRVAQILFKP